MRDSVIVVKHKQSGHILKVCEDEDAYEEWVEKFTYDYDEVEPKLCKIYESAESNTISSDAHAVVRNVR